MMPKDSPQPRPLPDLSELNRQDWQTALRAHCEDVGDYIELDPDHHIIQVGSGARLLVTFESASDIRNNHDLALPHGLTLAREDLDATVMVVLCQRPTWFRAPSIYAFFDALTDEGVFDDYDHVCFFGAGLGGYAAAAFSVAAPGADVIAISPQATLDPRLTEWDPRFVGMRKRSFSDRYGYAPEMAQAARHLLVLYNPDEELEAMHAALFARPSDPTGLTRFRCRYMGRDLPSVMEDLRILPDAIKLGLDGKLDLTRFAQLFRRRRDYAPYLRQLLKEVEELDRPKLITWLAGSSLKRKPMPAMRRALKRVAEREKSASAAE
ncbi:MAG: phosphoadenosine phosphosulfate reductase [Pseudomonadota bacterium]